VVSMNYRVGALGWMVSVTDNLWGNYGLQVKYRLIFISLGLALVLVLAAVFGVDGVDGVDGVRCGRCCRRRSFSG